MISVKMQMSLLNIVAGSKQQVGEVQGMHFQVTVFAEAYRLEVLVIKVALFCFTIIKSS